MTNIRERNWRRIMRISGGLCGCGVAIGGVFVFIISFSIDRFFWGLWQIVFGVLCILAEMRTKRMLSNVMFLSTFVGRGVFFVFVGTLCFPSDGSAFWYWIIGCVCIANGFFNIGLSIFDPALRSSEVGDDKGASMQSLSSGLPTAQSSNLDNALAIARAADRAGLKPEDAIKAGKMAHDAGLRPQHIAAAANAI